MACRASCIAHDRLAQPNVRAEPTSSGASGTFITGTDGERCLRYLPCDCIGSDREQRRLKRGEGAEAVLPCEPIDKCGHSWETNTERATSVGLAGATCRLVTPTYADPAWSGSPADRGAMVELFDGAASGQKIRHRLSCRDRRILRWNYTRPCLSGRLRCASGGRPKGLHLESMRWQGGHGTSPAS